MDLKGDLSRSTTQKTGMDYVDVSYGWNSEPGVEKGDQQSRQDCECEMNHTR